ncbi:MAG: hypothetical protein M3020_11365 [Myxococcota bacterium]|nr:hypothetical protein [Myxococcota bacterium]
MADEDSQLVFAFAVNDTPHCLVSFCGRSFELDQAVHREAAIALSRLDQERIVCREAGRRDR